MRFTHHREKYTIYDGYPPQGLSEARRGIFLCFKVPNRRGGAPSGAAALITPDEYMANNSRIISEHLRFS